MENAYGAFDEWLATFAASPRVSAAAMVADKCDDHERLSALITHCMSQLDATRKARNTYALDVAMSALLAIVDMQAADFETATRVPLIPAVYLNNASIVAIPYEVTRMSSAFVPAMRLLCRVLNLMLRTPMASYDIVRVFNRVYVRLVTELPIDKLVPLYVVLSCHRPSVRDFDAVFELLRVLSDIRMPLLTNTIDTARLVEALHLVTRTVSALRHVWPSRDVNRLVATIFRIMQDFVMSGSPHYKSACARDMEEKLTHMLDNKLVPFVSGSATSASRARRCRRRSQSAPAAITPTTETTSPKSTG